MGWGTTFKSEIYLSKITFGNNYEIEEYIKEKEEEIEKTKNKLCMFASSTPKDICPNEWEDEMIRFLSNEVSSLTDYLEELIIEKTKAELLLVHVNENNISVSTLIT